MENMFYQASSVSTKPYLSDWDVSKVANMRGMFFQASAFNQNLWNWDTSQVTSMFGMFAQAVAFEKNIKKWDSIKSDGYGTHVQRRDGVLEKIRVRERN